MSKGREGHVIFYSNKMYSNKNYQHIWRLNATSHLLEVASFTPRCFCNTCNSKINSIFSPNCRNKICMSSVGNCDMKIYYMCLYV